MELSVGWVVVTYDRMFILVFATSFFSICGVAFFCDLLSIALPCLLGLVSLLVR